ncbi:GEVED domain-containing protein [Shewanella sp. 10N.286.54.B9]|uniref:GEVED domain-containing protein n=1 Tax=Shewanella sp. 10N.286.54.B9 TaxID=3229719 RepID=UPI00354B22D5
MPNHKLKNLALLSALAVSFSSVAEEVKLFNNAINFESSANQLNVERGQRSTPQTIELNHALDNALEVGNYLKFTVDNLDVQIQLTKVTVKNSDLTYIDGRSNDGSARLSMVKSKGKYSAKIYLGHSGYLLSSSANGGYTLSKFVEDNSPVDSSDRPASKSSPESRSSVNGREGLAGMAAFNSVAMAANDREVTIIVAYTAKLATEVGDVAAYIALMEKDTNDSYIASGIDATVNIVHSYQTGYVSTGDMSEDNSVMLNQATSDWLLNPNPLAPNGYGVELKSLRDQHSADVMVLLTDKNASSPWAGWAGEVGADQSNALFTMSSWGTFKNTFAHELGHLFGARHDTAADSTSTPYAYGHGFCNANNTWRTMMATSTSCTGTQLNAWSNPNKVYEGYTGGTADLNDNARLHNERVTTLSAFRTAAHNPPTATITVAAEASELLAATFEGQANDTDGNIVSTLWDFGDGVYHNKPYAEGYSATHTYQFPGTYTARFTATDNNGLINTTTQDITVTAPTGSGYCSAKSGNSFYQYTSSVNVNGLTHTSGSRLYTDQTELTPFTIHTNTPTGIELVQGTRSSSHGPYSDHWAVFVDLNQNNSFDDPGERLHFSTPRNPSSREPMLASITIPDTALAGVTRMRVIQSEKVRAGETELGACGDVVFGEVEDYNINIIKEPSPANFAANITTDNLTVSFADGSASNSDIASVEWDFGDGYYSQSSTSTSFNPEHTYSFAGSYTVKLTVTLKNGDKHTLTKVVEVTAPAGQNYCSAYAFNSKFQYTANVTVNGVSIDSGSAGYTDHTATVLPINYGDNTVSFRQGATGTDTSYNAEWKVYIDMNQDGLFAEDEIENVVYWINADTSNAIERPFTVPTTALTGKTRMRVVQSYEKITTSCGRITWGEVEDFTVELKTDTTDPVTPSDLANGVTKTGINVASKESKTFTFNVPAGAKNVNVHMGAGTGDPDLYVRFGEAATDNVYDCRPYTGGNRDETCDSSKLTQSGGLYYVTVKGYSASDNVTLTGTYEDGGVVDPDPTPTPTPNACATLNPQTRGNVTDGQAVCLGGNQVYLGLYVPAGQTLLTLKTSGGDGDASLYQSASGWPSTSNNQNSSVTANSNDEVITVTNPRSGWHYFLISGQGTGTDFVADYQ